MEHPNRLRLYRKKSPLSQKDIASILPNTSHSYVSRIEAGERKPSLDLILAYSLLFNTSIEDFLNDRIEEIRTNLILELDAIVIAQPDLFSGTISTRRKKYIESTLERLSTYD